MRNSYFDSGGRGTGKHRMGLPEWKLEEKSGPYGKVSGSSPLPEGGGTLSEVGAPVAVQKSRMVRKGYGGLPGFGVFLALLALLAGVEFAVRPSGEEMPSEEPLWEEWWSTGDWEENWQADLPDTSISRAEPNPNIRLTLESAEETALSPQEIYRELNPAVVEVRTYLGVDLDWDYSTGSGVVMTEDGYVLTNAHVIAGASRAEVVFFDGRLEEAQMVGYDGDTDLAVLKLEASGLKTARFGNSAELQVGDPAYAIGNPTGSELRGTMTDGIISAVDRRVETRECWMTLIQHSAPINPGNSGGALVNRYGQVVGLTNMKMMSFEETYEGLGFAIPTSVIKPVADQIIAYGNYAEERILGITACTVEAGEGSPGGACVETVMEDSDAWEKGIRPGDIIVAVYGIPVTDMEDLLCNMYPVDQGETVRLEVWSRDMGTTRSVDVSLIAARTLE